jgi:HEAT repeat protein
MTELVVLIVGFGAAMYGLLANMRKGDNRVRAWQEAARSCGLQIEEADSAGNPRVKARAGPFEVRIEMGGEKGRLAHLLVLGPAPPDFYNMKVRPESTYRSAREIEIGDPSFDSTFSIEGPTRLVLALLDAETRRLLFRVHAEGRLDLSWGELRSETTDEQVAAVLPLLLDIRKRFTPTNEVRQRLAANAIQDPESGVRLQNLLVLIRELPGDPGTAEVLRKACSDRNPEIRLRAAKALGAEGRGVLLEVAENPEYDAVSAEAVSALEGKLPFERAAVILDRALSRSRLQTARACLKAIGRGGDAAAVDLLVKVMSTEKGDLAAGAAQALEAIGSPTAEPALIQALQRDQPGLRVAAANALRRVGSVAAVLPLKELADRFLLGEIRKAARQAIAEIQSRLQGAAPGQLSIAGAEAGQLSLAQGEAGQLSLAENPAGQLSLPPEEPPA